MDNQAELTQVQNLYNESVQRTTDFRRIYFETVGESFTEPNFVEYRLKLTPEARNRLSNGQNVARYFPILLKEPTPLSSPRVDIYSPTELYVPFTNTSDDISFTVKCALANTPPTAVQPGRQFFTWPSHSFVKFS